MGHVTRRKFLLASGALLLAAPVRAQPREYTYGTRADLALTLAAFKEDLREGGLAKGQRLRIEYRLADDDYRKVNRLGEDLVRANVQGIYASSLWAVHGAKAATATIPIVFSLINDPVGVKFVQSLDESTTPSPMYNIFQI